MFHPLPWPTGPRLHLPAFMHSMSLQGGGIKPGTAPSPWGDSSLGGMECLFFFFFCFFHLEDSAEENVPMYSDSV